MERSHDRYSSRRNKSRSVSPHSRKGPRASSRSPKHHRESLSPERRKPSRGGTRFLEHYKGSRSSLGHSYSSSHRSRRSRSRSGEGRPYSTEKEDTRKSEKLKQEYKREERNNDSYEDAKGSRDAKEEKSTTSHKRSSGSYKDETYKNEERIGNNKKSKVDYQSSDRGDFVDEYSELSPDKRSVPSKTSRSHKSSTNVDDVGVENLYSSIHDRSRSNYRKHDKTESSKEKERVDDRKSSHRSSSRSHRSSRHQGEDLDEGIVDNSKVGKSKDKNEKRDNDDTIRTTDQKLDKTEDEVKMDSKGCKGEKNSKKLMDHDEMTKKLDYEGVSFTGINKDSGFPNNSINEGSSTAMENGTFHMGVITERM